MDVFLEQYFDITVMSESFDKVLLGFWMTIQLSLIAGALSMVWGLVLALCRTSRSWMMLPLRVAAVTYIDVFRGIPLLLVVLLISGSLPFIPGLPEWIRAPELFGRPDVYWFGVAALTLTYGAYLAEVYRAGLDAVPPGQTEAARSLGMSHRRALRHVVLPQAVRTVVPPLLNDFIALMKDTSLVQVIGIVDVVRAGREVQGETFNSSALTLGALMFLVVTLPLARLVDRYLRGRQPVRKALA
ncbi:polar amino acid ABC transporter permease [Sphaerisporangium rufum]|uniref:Polar amino acid ABC transporter permease n=1 Tax=Sphaerisporangium rufum TaxID=1381558 RepID=A0A919UZM5_9ACTN|nr:amino acid ABC transporter permease [Sphaerisporangium rufum]GII76467.1 polar amino acid ABC transporter permease [Sphaerisporangium rufum]